MADNGRQPQPGLNPDQMDFFELLRRLEGDGRLFGFAGDTYVCPCHGSRYSLNGQVTGGPARASLRRYTTTFTDGVVTIAL